MLLVAYAYFFAPGIFLENSSFKWNEITLVVMSSSSPFLTDLLGIDNTPSPFFRVIAVLTW